MNPVTEDTRYVNSLEIQRRLSYAHRYNDWLFREIKQYIGRRILEIGCAFGNFTKKMQDRDFLCAIDIEGEYVHAMKKEFQSFSQIDVLQYDISSPEVLELKSQDFDTIVCLNVLEHIKDDSVALENMHQLLRKEGYLCLIVPAFQSIFSEMDRTDHHYRRYDKGDLLKKIKEAGFDTVRAKYMNMPGFLGWWFNGKILRRRFIPFRQMLMYDKIVPLVSFIEKVFDPPFGQSLILVAKK